MESAGATNMLALSSFTLVFSTAMVNLGTGSCGDWGKMHAKLRPGKLFDFSGLRAALGPEVCTPVYTPEITEEVLVYSLQIKLIEDE